MSEILLNTPQQVYQPTFDIIETMSTGLGDKKIGERIAGIVTYQVIEKTKSYTVLRVKYFYLTSSKRRF